MKLNQIPLSAYRVVEAPRTTALALGDEAPVLRCVEHLMAALAGAGIRAGVSIDVAGDEIPFVDGGARAFSRALAELAIPSGAPELAIHRAAVLTEGESSYRFTPTPGEGCSVSVALEFDDVRIAPRAAWRGDPVDFAERIAPARTFIFAQELARLSAAAIAFHAPRESVVVIADEGMLAAGAPSAPDEPARHKLLDLVGDLYLYGGPPRGALEATRPGHARTHAVLRRALAEGIVVPVPSPR